MLDGAMGTMIQKYGLGEEAFRGTLFAGHGVQLKGNNDLLVLTRPDVISEIHSRYLAAGADIIETCTFNANAVSQAEYGCEHLCARINREAAGLPVRWPTGTRHPKSPVTLPDLWALQDVHAQ